MAIDFADDPRGVQLELMLERAKYERFVLSEVDALLTREYDHLADLLLSSRYRDLTRFQQQRAQALFREIATRLGATYQDATDLVLREMRGYAALEGDLAQAQSVSMFTAGGQTLTVTLGPSLPRAYLSAIARLPIQGLSLGEWFAGQAQTMSLATKRLIQQGLVEGKGTAAIARMIAADPRTDGPVLARRARSEARAITRTTVNAVQNDAAVTSYRTLPPSVSDSWRFLAVRDARTTAVCAALDGRVFRNDDETAPVPPRHINCRSSVTPVIKGVDEATRRQQSGPMSFATFGDWLKTQPAATQNRILGVARADLWRSGRVSLADTVDADNRLLSLTQLRERLGIATSGAK